MGKKGGEKTISTVGWAEEGQKMIEAREAIEKRNRMAEYERRKKVLCGG